MGARRCFVGLLVSAQVCWGGVFVTWGVMNAFLGMVIVLVWFSCFDGLVGVVRALGLCFLVVGFAWVWRFWWDGCMVSFAVIV